METEDDGGGEGEEYESFFVKLVYDISCFHIGPLDNVWTFLELCIHTWHTVGKSLGTVQCPSGKVQCSSACVKAAIVCVCVY